MFKDYLTSFTVFLEILKKKKEKKSSEKKLWKKSSENDQSTKHFQSFFIYFFIVPPTLGLKKNSRKSTNKKILALVGMSMVKVFLKAYYAADDNLNMKIFIITQNLSQNTVLF